MFNSVRPHGVNANALTFEGTAEQAFEMFEALAGDEAAMFIAGLQVISASDGSLHNGHRAIRFHLGDKFGSRSVGRLVLVEDAGTYEEQVAWEVFYATDAEAQENLRIWSARKARPRIVAIEVDLVGADNEALAEYSAQFGISMQIEQLCGPTGHPVVRVSGLTDNVERFLREAYGSDDDGVSELLDA
jgi:hypothetical protein